MIHYLYDHCGKLIASGELDKLEIILLNHSGNGYLVISEHPQEVYTRLRVAENRREVMRREFDSVDFTRMTDEQYTVLRDFLVTLPKEFRR